MTEAKQIMQIAYDALDEKLGRDIVVIDVENVCSFTNYLVIAHGDSSSQVTALLDNVQMKLHQADFHASSVEGQRAARWVLLDYQNVVINIFCKEDRQWYDLERMWRDGKFLNEEEIHA